MTNKRFHELSFLRVVNLCYAVSYMLTFGVHALREEEGVLELDPSSLHMWRRIFRRITVVLQDVKLPEGRTLTAGDRRLVDLCFHWLHYIDVGEYYDGSNDATKELEWRKHFKPAESPVSNHFVFLLSRIYPGDDPYWRLRMLEAMPEEDRLAAIKDDEHDDAEEDSNRVDQPLEGSTMKEEEATAQQGILENSGEAETQVENKAEMTLEVNQGVGGAVGENVLAEEEQSSSLISGNVGDVYGV